MSMTTGSLSRAIRASGLDALKSSKVSLLDSKISQKYPPSPYPSPLGERIEVRGNQQF